IGYLERIYRPGTYNFSFGFGTLRIGGFEGLLPPSVVAEYRRRVTGTDVGARFDPMAGVTRGEIIETTTLFHLFAQDIERALQTAARERDFLANAWRNLSNVVDAMFWVMAPFGRIMQAVADFNDTKDQLLEFGNWKCFVYFTRNTESGDWSTPTNAVYTVPTGKKLVCMMPWPYHGLIEDPTNRQARFRNTTDSTDIFAPAAFSDRGAILSFRLIGDVDGPTTFHNVVAGKTVKLELWNQTGGNRGMGAVAICKEMEA
ncbi:MAG: hypothetical protein V3S82_04645, partial [Dehalococcoidia bacterium]